MKDLSFEMDKCSDASTWKRPGKPEWQTMIRVAVPRDWAASLIFELVRGLARTDGSTIEPVLFGELTETEESE